NPFALASWLHLVLVRCHPFDDGNGRTTRLISSIPLLRHGSLYPWTCGTSTSGASTKLTRKFEKAYHGNHGRLTQCMLDGMTWSIDKVR
ncbi:hypothetical protein BDZ89DRAFT_937028, partial [Hymenopellis radicata]